MGLITEHGKISEHHPEMPSERRQKLSGLEEPMPTDEQYSYMEKVFTFLAILSLGTLAGRYFGYGEEVVIALSVITGMLLLYSMATILPQKMQNFRVKTAPKIGALIIRNNEVITPIIKTTATKFSMKFARLARALVQIPSTLRRQVFSFNVALGAVKYLMAKNSTLKVEIENLKSEVKALDDQLRDIVNVWKPTSNMKVTNDYFATVKATSLSDLTFEEAGPNKRAELINESFSAEV